MEGAVLITGASRGLGLGLVREFLQAGHRVVATCRQPSSATQVCLPEGF